MKRVWIVMLLTLILSACSTATENPPAAESATPEPQAVDDAAARVVEQYLEAKISGDERTLQGLLCAEMEADLAREATAFSTVSDARIENMACTTNEGGSSVSCTGEIVATYGMQDETFPLSTYRVVQEDGEWKWCGEGE